jgi:hypothetical protein
MKDRRPVTGAPVLGWFSRGQALDRFPVAGVHSAADCGRSATGQYSTQHFPHSDLIDGVALPHDGNKLRMAYLFSAISGVETMWIVSSASVPRGHGSTFCHQ